MVQAHKITSKTAIDFILSSLKEELVDESMLKSEGLIVGLIKDGKGGFILTKKNKWTDGTDVYDSDPSFFSTIARVGPGRINDSRLRIKEFKEVGDGDVDRLIYRIIEEFRPQITKDLIFKLHTYEQSII